MVAASRPLIERDDILSALDVAIEALNLAKEIAVITPAKAVFGSVSALLIMIKDSMANRADCVELGLTCAYVCKVLDRGMNGRTADQLSPNLLEAIEHLRVILENIQRKVGKMGQRGVVSRLFRSKNDKDAIAGWKSDLNGLLHVFNTELGMDTNAEVLNTRNIALEIHRIMVEHVAGGGKSARTSTPGELPPPPPRACFGRSELIEKVISLAQALTPIALIGPGGIGKTSVSLAALHDDRIKERFGGRRRFIRCDQFPASRTHFLARLAKVIGADIENPEDLTPLRPSLSSNEMLIVLDNAESILDPQNADGQGIYRLVEELSEFNNICLLITSRITTIPPNCQTLEIQPLSAEAAHDTFHNIYKYGERSEPFNDILKQLEFHPLSITLLATVAQQNRWDNKRLVREWEGHKTGMLETEHKTSLATTIELSLHSPMFRELGPDARALLEVIAFYPQGIDENNVAWLFPTIQNATRLFDTLCNLSLIHRSNGFITMLAPLRDHFCPKDPRLSPLLCSTKDRYFARLSVETGLSLPGFQDTQWILSEDGNVEHLLDVFTSVLPDSDDTWDACLGFVKHLCWHKPQQTVLRKKIEELPDDHRSKPQCLRWLAMLSGSIGNRTEGIRFLEHAFKLGREEEDNSLIARVLGALSDPTRGHYKGGIRQAMEALEIYEQLGETLNCARCLNAIARLLRRDGQLDAAREATVELIKLLPDTGEEHLACESHYFLGDIYRLKGDREKAVHHYDLVIGIASTSNLRHYLFWAHFALADIFLGEDGLNNAQRHIERAKAYELNNAYNVGRVAHLQAQIWYRQREFKDAASEALRAQKIFKNLGNSKCLQDCNSLLRKVEGAMGSLPPSSGSDSNANASSSTSALREHPP